MKQDSFEKLVDKVDGIITTLNEVKSTGDKTNDQATRTNSRVYKLEDDVKEINLSRAGRYVDCPNRDDIDSMKTHMVSQKAVKREMRFWFLSVLIPVIGLLLSIWFL